MIDSSNAPIILFIPEAGIYPYIRSLAVVGDALKQHGRKVYLTRCTGQMACYLMMGVSVDASPERKKSTCEMGRKQLDYVKKIYGFEIVELNDMIDSSEQRVVDNLIAVPPEKLESLEYRGFPVGKTAQFDFTLATKYLYHPHLPNKYQKTYAEYIKNIAQAIALTEQICRRLQPSLILTFGEYGQYQGVRHAANLHQVPRIAIAHPMHYNTDFSRFLMWKPTNEFWFYTHCQKWNSGKNIPIRAEYVTECWNDVVFRLFSAGKSHIFSPRKESDPLLVFNKLQLDPRKKTIIVYTSSYDERNAKDVVMKVWGEGPRIVDAFPDQITWLAMLRDYAAKHDNIQIVVRVHPREGSRQYGFDSEHLMQLKAKFTENTPSFMVVWPDDSLSSYDLMELADVCLVTWSLMGQEAARLGIPVLSCTGNMFYSDDDFIQVATTSEEYVRKLDSIVQMEYSWQHLVKAIRFYHWRTFVPSLNLGETVPVDCPDDTVWPEAPVSKIGVLNEVLSGRQDLLTYNLEEWKTSLPADALIRESEAIRQGIRRFLDKIFYHPIARVEKPSILFRIYNKIRRTCRKVLAKKTSFIKKIEGEAFIDYQLEYTIDTSRLEEFRQKTKHDSNLRVIVADGPYATLVHDGNLLRRMSPMVIRLARLHSASLNNQE